MTQDPSVMPSAGTEGNDLSLTLPSSGTEELLQSFPEAALPRAVIISVSSADWTSTLGSYRALPGTEFIELDETNSVVFFPNKANVNFEIHLCQSATAKVVPCFGTKDIQGDFDNLKKYMAGRGSSKNDNKTYKIPDNSPSGFYIVTSETYTYKFHNQGLVVVETEIGITNNPNYKP